MRSMVAQILATAADTREVHDRGNAQQKKPKTHARHWWFT